MPMKSRKMAPRRMIYKGKRGEIKKDKNIRLPDGTRQKHKRNGPYGKANDSRRRPECITNKRKEQDYDEQE